MWLENIGYCQRPVGLQHSKHSSTVQDLITLAVPMIMVVPEHCIIATNTSALPIAEIAAPSRNREKVIGIHYFSPVPKMELVEIVISKNTSQDTIAASVDFCQRQGKTTIVVNDSPGFFTTRCLGALMSTACRMLLEGVSIERLDKCSLAAGIPIGVATLLDEVGIDIGVHAIHNLTKVYGAKMEPCYKELNTLGDAMGAAGFLGKKTGAGMYVYDGKKKTVNLKALELMKDFHVEPRMELTDDHIQERMILRATLEGIRCLEENVITTPVEGDVGLVFGVGYPPHLGGPFRFVDRMGADKLVDRLRHYEEHMGENFSPCQLLLDMAKDSKKFHKT